MKPIPYEYNEIYIEFLPSSKTNVMVNATQMAKIFGKKVNDFLENSTTKAFIEACLKNGNSRFLNIQNVDELVTSKQRNGTWMHRILALKFAAWLDPEFELWVYATIDKIVNEYATIQRETLVEKLTLKKEIDELSNRLANTNSEYRHLLELQDKYRKANNRGKRATAEQKYSLQTQLFPSEDTPKGDEMD